MSVRPVTSFILLAATLGACGGAAPEAPRPFCTTIKVGDQFPMEKVDGALTLALSPLSPKGGQKRIVDQPVLIVDLKAAAGPNCKAVEAYFATAELPPNFKSSVVTLGGRPQLFVDEVSPRTLLPTEGFVLSSGVSLEPPIVIQPGQTRRLILTIDSTYFEPGTTGQAALVGSLGWRIAGDKAGRAFQNKYDLPIQGNAVSFTTTMVEACRAVEEKITAVAMPLKGWMCKGGLGSTIATDFLVYAPPDQASCRLHLKDLGAAPITAAQITSNTAIDVSFDGGDTFKCTHQ